MAVPAALACSSTWVGLGLGLGLALGFGLGLGLGLLLDLLLQRAQRAVQLEHPLAVALGARLGGGEALAVVVEGLARRGEVGGDQAVPLLVRVRVRVRVTVTVRVRIRP